jgi:hypothetical protein
MKAVLAAGVLCFALTVPGGIADALASKADLPALVFPAYRVQLAADSAPILVLNKHLSLTVTLEPLLASAPAVTGFGFDARMPQHKHGMVTKAKVTKVNDLTYRVDGVRLHMPGDWVLDFVITHPVGETRISVPYSLAAM